MDIVLAKLTVFFEEPFWVGLFEREFNGYYEVCKVTFGAEPKDYEVYDFLLHSRNKLQFSPPLETEKADISRKINPKRLKRLIQKQLQNVGIGTKAQQALKLQQEQGKSERRLRHRDQQEANQRRQFELRCEKRKEKHRGH